jgi:GT2 family glycosyltransferase
MIQLAILLTCFNRKQTTLSCLEQLFSLKQDIDVYLVDDLSTDRTSEAVGIEFPQVNIICGTGNLFWNRGMYLAWEHASKNNYDYYIWLNDDTILYNNCFKELFECSNLANENAIITGIVESKDKNQILYGGTNHKKKLLLPNGTMQPVTNMNGNIVLVPKSVFDILGNLDPVFHHDLGDVDYGLRAKKNNINVFTTRVSIGSGESNSFCRVRLWNSTIVKRFKKLYSPLGNHPTINFYFRRKHFGFFNALNYYIHIHLINLFSDCIIKFIFGTKYIDK